MAIRGLNKGHTAPGEMADGLRWARMFVENWQAGNKKAALADLDALTAALENNGAAYAEASAALVELSTREQALRKMKTDADLAITAAREAEVASAATFAERKRVMDAEKATLDRESAEYREYERATKESLGKSYAAVTNRETAVGAQEAANTERSAQLDAQARELAKELDRLMSIRADLQATLSNL